MKRVLLLFVGALCASVLSAQNPYLPLWEHIPDGEPRVFEDPDNPGKFRAYIIGSHDLTYTAYCGSDVRMWSAPVEDLSQWRDEGPLFTWFVDGQWDTMYAPDLVEVKDKATGKKTYYLYPHSRGRNRVAMVCKSDRPDGPFTPVNATEDGRGCLPGSLIDFDPSVFIETITDRKDPDFDRGFRAYVYYGFQHSTAVELDPETMYSKRPGTEIHDFFLPASSRYGVVRDPEGTEYKYLYKDQDPGSFNFFEASSIRQVGNKYVMVFSGYSGPDYGLESTNSALRYAYGDSPLGPWRSGGVLVDSRGVVPDENGEHLMTANAAHNTHGSLQEINGQWYVFYHRPPRGFGNARQSMVAPVKIEWDEKKVADGGQVRITGYDPYAPGNEWVASASDGQTYSGAEVTSEGFQIFGLPTVSPDLSAARWPDGMDNDDNENDFRVQKSLTLAAPAKAGSRNIKVSSVDGLVINQRLFIGPGHEEVIAANIGSAGASSLAEAAAKGATRLSVSGVTGFAVGQEVFIGEEKASIAEIHAARRGWFSPVPSAPDAVVLAAPLKAAHAAGESFAGSGITVSAPLRSDYASGTPVTGALPTPGAPNRF